VPYYLRGSPTPDPNYDIWTRLPLIYLPVLLNGDPIGYLWASKSRPAANFLDFLAGGSVDMHRRMDLRSVWQDRLRESYRQRMTPLDAVRQWRGAPAHPRAGAIPADAVEAEITGIRALFQQAYPDRPPMDDADIVDGTYADGRPVGFSQGRGPVLHSTPPRYRNETDAPVSYREITDSRGLLIGYLWASPAEDAAGYLPRRAAGEMAFWASGLWEYRLNEAHAEWLSPLEALHRYETAPVDGPYGGISRESPVLEAGSLAELRALAEQQTGQCP
jgi:hypothetical protein